MAGKIQIPVNLEDPTVLKRFLTNLVLDFNTNPLITGTAEEVNAALSQAFGAGDSSFLDTLADIADVQTKIKTYVEQNVETLIKQNTQNIALVAEQFGTFYNDALAASWYGLSVKAGGTVAGLEIGSLDPNTTTPGDESSYFRVAADSFLVGRAYEDLSQEEKDYLAANGLPNFGTVYSAEGDPVPAFLINWDSNTQQYNIYFNGRVSFNNMDTGLTDGNGNTLIDGAFIKTGSITTTQLEMDTGWAGVIYNQGGSAASYSMKIDFTNGEIHIK
jgi:uncharacterized protein (DUF2164 family)